MERAETSDGFRQTLCRKDKQQRRSGHVIRFTQRPHIFKQQDPVKRFVCCKHKSREKHSRKQEHSNCSTGKINCQDHAFRTWRRRFCAEQDRRIDRNFESGFKKQQLPQACSFRTSCNQPVIQQEHIFVNNIQKQHKQLKLFQLQQKFINLAVKKLKLFIRLDEPKFKQLRRWQFQRRKQKLRRFVR